jgi:hypothetical protein
MKRERQARSELRNQQKRDAYDLAKYREQSFKQNTENRLNDKGSRASSQMNLNREQMNEHLRNKYERQNTLGKIREEHNNFLEQRRQQKDQIFNSKMQRVASMKEADMLAMKEVQKMKFERELEKVELKRRLKPKTIEIVPATYTASKYRSRM